MVDPPDPREPSSRRQERSWHLAAKSVLLAVLLIGLGLVGLLYAVCGGFHW